MKVRSSPRARRDLDGILQALLMKASPETALRVVERLEARCKSLADFPARGAPYRRPKLRRFRRIVEAPFVIVYEVRERDVEIFTVLHGAWDIEKALTGTGLKR